MCFGSLTGMAIITVVVCKKAVRIFKRINHTQHHNMESKMTLPFPALYIKVNISADEITHSCR